MRHGRPSILQEVDIGALADLASKRNCTIELVTSFDDAALDAARILRVFGAGEPILDKNYELT